jgi:hypothetical protein
MSSSLHLHRSEKDPGIKNGPADVYDAPAGQDASVTCIIPVLQNFTFKRIVSRKFAMLLLVPLER